MNIPTENKIDYQAAKYAQRVVKQGADENTITKALGVLQENGPYACFLYLQANKDKTIIPEMINLLEGIKLLPPAESNGDTLKRVTEQITVDLPRLLLAKEVIEQMLIYARYGAKARGKDAN